MLSHRNPDSYYTFKGKKEDKLHAMIVGMIVEILIEYTTIVIALR